MRARVMFGLNCKVSKSAYHSDFVEDGGYYWMTTRLLIGAT